MSTVLLVETIAPELTGDARIPTGLALAAGRLGAVEFGAQLANAQAFWAAHWVTMKERELRLFTQTGGMAAGAAGVVSSMKTGDVGITWAQVAGGAKSTRDAWLSLTTHGLSFLELRGSRPASTAFLVVID